MSIAPPSSAERRKQVRVSVRSDLHVEHRRIDGRSCYVVRDPITLRYYQFPQREHFLLRQMDGTHTLDEVRQRYEEHFPPHRLRLEELESFARLLTNAGLAHSESAEAGLSLFVRREEQQRARRHRLWTDVLAIRVPLFDPDRLLTWMSQRLRWLFTVGFATIAGSAALMALLLVLVHFDTFRTRLPSTADFFTAERAVMLWLCLAAVTVVHELAHGITCKAFGGEVHELGVLVLFFAPSLYCDVSDAWSIPKKWQRIVVSLAGMFAELLIATLAVFVWWNTGADSFIHHLCFNLMLVCGVNTVIFNANPLLRFDGYYALADWLEIPNLQQRAGRKLKRSLLKIVFGIDPPAEPGLGQDRATLLLGYALASGLYRWLVTIGVLWFLYQFLKPQGLGVLACLAALLAIWSMLCRPVLAALRRFSKTWRLPLVKPRRVLLSCGITVLIIISVALVPLPLGGVNGLAVVQIEPTALDKVYVPATGILEKVHVYDGQRVEPDQILAEFRSPDLETRLEEARSEHDIRTTHLALVNELSPQMRSSVEAAQLDVTRVALVAEQKHFAAQTQVYAKQLQRLVVRAPRPGVALNPPRAEDVGRSYQPVDETPICTIADPTRLRALMPVSAADYRRIGEEMDQSAPVTVKLRIGGKTYPGIVIRLPESEAKEIPLALAVQGGGDVPAEPGFRQDVAIPKVQRYLVEVEILEPNATIVPGSVADVKVRCRWRSAGWWALSQVWALKSA